LDVIGGAAGCIAALLSLQKCRPSDAVMNAAIRCGEHLLATPSRCPRDRLVHENRECDADCRLLHGCSGIAWALCELWHDRDERYENAAIDAVLYERSNSSRGRQLAQA